MKLRGLQIEQVRKFARPVRVEGFTDGLNLLAGPNEMGKSTILAALKAVVFERHRAGGEQVRSLRPAGSRAAPWIGLDFELDGEAHRIEKRFLQSPYARLTLPTGERFEGSDAEDELQRRLGFDAPPNRGPNPDSLGPWGVLWVGQGGSFEQADVVERTRTDLDACLVAEVGALVGTDEARRLRDQFEAELYELIDRRARDDRPKGAFKRTVDALQDARLTLAELEARQARLEAEVEALTRIRRELRQLEDVREDERLATERRRAQARLDEIRGIAERIQTEESELKLTLQALTTLKKQSAERARRRERLAGLVAEIQTSRDQLAPLVDAIAARERELTGRAVELGRLEAAERAARHQLRTARRREDESRAAAELERLRQRREEVQRAAAWARTRRTEAARIELDRPRLDGIRAIARDFEQAEAALGAFRTRVGFDLLEAAQPRVRVDGQALSAASIAIETARPLKVEVEGIGTFAITPGAGQEAAASRRDRLQARLRQALEEIGVASIADAERRLTTREHLMAEARQAEERVRLLVETAIPGASAPQALDDAIAALDRPRPNEPEDEAGSPAAADVVAIETDLDALGDRIGALRREHARLGEERDRDRDRHTRLVESLRLRSEDRTRVSARLDAELEAEPDDQLAAQLAEASTRAARAGERIARLRADLAARPQDVAEANLERIDRQIRGRSERRERLRIEASALAAGIARAEGEGLQEAIDAAGRRAARLADARAAYEQDIGMLRLLIQSLDEAGRAARERYFAPVRARLLPYLRWLFPGAELSLDDDFKIVGITRDGGREEPFEELSDGTREQIGVLTRLAFAELLAEHGRPTVVVLDDALVFSDQDRLQRMFDVLNHAARKLQILVLTCREQAFEGLAATRVRLVETADAAPEVAA